jgi:hypothetical protein
MSQPFLRRRSRERFVSRAALAAAVILILPWLHSLGWNTYVSRQSTTPTGNPATMHHYQRVASSNWGCLWLAYVVSEVEAPADPAARKTHWYWGAGKVQTSHEYDAPPWLRRLGVDWRNFTRGATNGAVPVYVERMVSIPYWPPTLIAVSAWWWIGKSDRRERRRHRKGLCPACSYDVRATPNRCPECGYVPEPGGRAAAASASA